MIKVLVMADGGGTGLLVEVFEDELTAKIARQVMSAAFPGASGTVTFTGREPWDDVQYRVTSKTVRRIS